MLTITCELSLSTVLFYVHLCVKGQVCGHLLEAEILRQYAQTRFTLSLRRFRVRRQEFHPESACLSLHGGKLASHCSHTTMPQLHGITRSSEHDISQCCAPVNSMHITIILLVNLPVLYLYKEPILTLKAVTYFSWFTWVGGTAVIDRRKSEIYCILCLLYMYEFNDCNLNSPSFHIWLCSFLVCKCKLIDADFYVIWIYTAGKWFWSLMHSTHFSRHSSMFEITWIL